MTCGSVEGEDTRMVTGEEVNTEERLDEMNH